MTCTFISIDTDGKAITSAFGNLHRHPRNYCEMANIDLKVGDARIGIRFKTWQEMISFCDEHNFTYKDDRTGVDKYISRMSI